MCEKVVTKKKSIIDIKSTYECRSNYKKIIVIAIIKIKKRHMISICLKSGSYHFV